MKNDRHSFTDVDEFAGRMRGMGWQGEITQTEVGAFRVDLSVYQAPGVAGVRTRHSVANAREVNTPANARTFGVVVPELDRNKWCQHQFDEVVVQMMPRCDYAAANPAGHLGYQLAFDDARVAEVAAQLDICMPLADDACILELSDARLDRLLTLLADVFDVDCEFAQVRASDELLALFLSCFQEGTSRVVSPRATLRLKAFRRAREYMHAHVDEAITLADIARHANASRRTLTKAFNEGLGLSPMNYLKLLRLNRVRQTLCRPERHASLVVDAANANGFWHMGQFASDYRRLFGELPSDTVRNGRAFNHSALAVTAPRIPGNPAETTLRSSASGMPGPDGRSIRTAR